MPGSPVVVGPFEGGLNTFSDPSAIDDKELTTCENFELDLDGSLKARPPVFDSLRTLSIPAQTSGGAPKLLGWYLDASTGLSYLICSDGVNKTYAIEQTSGTVTTISSTLSAAAFAQFNGFAYLTAAPTSSQTGGHWKPGSSFAADANMPKADSITQQGSRLWLSAGVTATANPTRVYYSNLITNATFWPASPNYFEVGNGDGEVIVAILWYYGSLLVFRTHSLYQFQYQGDPGNGVISVVLPELGLDNVNCITVSEAFLYFLYRDRLYEFISGRAQQVNIKVPLMGVSPSGLYFPKTVSEFNKRILVGYYDVTYVYNRNTRTWSTWKSTAWGPLGPALEIPGNSTSTVYLTTNYSPAPGSAQTVKLLELADQFDATHSETYACTMRTKNFSYNEGARVKRLFWWGVDAIFSGVMNTAIAQITQTFTSTWGRGLTRTWGQALHSTWGKPWPSAPDVTDTVDTTGQSVSRRFAKLMHPLRFRQIAFTLIFNTDGTTNTGPVRVFSLTTFVLAKEKAVAEIS